MRRAESLKEVVGGSSSSVNLEISTLPARSVTVRMSRSRDSLTFPQALGFDPGYPASTSPCPSTEETYIDVVDPQHHHHQVSLSKSDDNVTTKGKGSKKTNLKRSMSMKNLSKSFGSRVLHVLTFPKRMRQQAAEKKRFNIYSMSVETREQLKQIYVY